METVAAVIRNQIHQLVVMGVALHVIIQIIHHTEHYVIAVIIIGGNEIH